MASLPDVLTPELGKEPSASIALSPLPPPNSSTMDLLQIALQNNAAIDVIERLAALQERAWARDSEIAFTAALSRVQAEIKRVAPDLLNPQTSSKYASYAALDRRIRPIYSKECLSLSFDTGECSKPDHVLVLCYVSLGAYTRTYRIEMPSDGKGARGGDVMSKTHATGAAMAYGMRYLLKAIFNVAVGEEDDDGNLETQNAETPSRIARHCELLRTAKTFDTLKEFFRTAYREATEAQDKVARDACQRAYETRKRELWANLNTGVRA